MVLGTIEGGLVSSDLESRAWLLDRKGRECFHS